MLPRQGASDLRPCHDDAVFKVIRWSGYPRVNNQAGAESVIARMSKALGDPLLSCERYWKMPEPAEVRMTSPLDVQEPQEAVFRVLLTAQRIAGPWSVRCHMFNDGLDFEGLASKTGHAHFAVPDVEWLLFSMAVGEAVPQPEQDHPLDRRARSVPEQTGNHGHSQGLPVTRPALTCTPVFPAQ